jgi:hypothetical protein
VNQIDPKNCTLRLVAQREVEPCPHELCVFWEPGGAVVEGGCVIERLGADLRRADLAEYLLETRERLELMRDLAEADAVHREFARRIGESL